MTNKYLIILLLFILSIPLAYSQVDEDVEEDEIEANELDSEFPQPTTKVAKFFDDGTKSLAKNAVKFDIMGVIRGNLNIYYERRLGNVLSVEALGGLKYTNGLSMITLASEEELFSKTELLKSPVFGANIKYFNNGGAIDFGNYYGLGFVQENLSFPKTDVRDAYKMSMTYYRFSMGMNFLKNKASAWDVGTFFGIVTAKVKEGTYQVDLPVFLDYGFIIRYGLFL